MGYTLERLSQFGDECAYAQLQDGKVDGEIEAGGQDVEEEVLICCDELGLNKVVLAKKHEDKSEEDCHQDRCGNNILVEDFQEAGKLDVFKLFRLLLALVHSLSQVCEESKSEHLLVCDGETGAVRQFLGNLYRQVGSDGPVESEDQAHQEKDRRVAESREAEHDQPECCGSLLHLDVARCEDRPELCDFSQSYKDDVEYKSNQEQDHDLRKRTVSENTGFKARCDSVLAKVRVDDHSVKIEAVFQSDKDRAEVADQSAGTDDKDHVSDYRFDKAG